MHVIREPTSVKHLKSVRLMSLVVARWHFLRWETFYIKKKRAFTRTRITIVKSFGFTYMQFKVTYWVGCHINYVDIKNFDGS